MNPSTSKPTVYGPFDYLHGIDIDLMARVANILGKRKDLEAGDPPKERLGGILAAVSINSKDVGMSHADSIRIGHPGLKIGDNAFFAWEKIRRLMSHRVQGGSPKDLHWFASQSQNPAEEKYAGAVVGVLDSHEDLYIGYSGAPAMIDEALCYIIAQSNHLGIPDDYPSQNIWVDRATRLIAANKDAMGCVTKEPQDIDYD